MRDKQRTARFGGVLERAISSALAGGFADSSRVCCERVASRVSSTGGYLTGDALARTVLTYYTAVSRR